jgi:hypothetical protein
MSDPTEQLRDNAREWDISECPQRAEIARRAAARIDKLEALNDRAMIEIVTMQSRISKLEAELAKYELRVITQAGKYEEDGYIVSKEPGGEFEWEWLSTPMTVYVKRES